MEPVDFGRVSAVQLQHSSMILQYSSDIDSWRLGTPTHLETLDSLPGRGWIACSHDNELRGASALLCGCERREAENWWLLHGEHVGADVKVMNARGDLLRVQAVGVLWYSEWISGFEQVTVEIDGFETSFAELDETGLSRFAHAPSIGHAVARACLGSKLSVAQKIADTTGFQLIEKLDGWTTSIHRSDVIRYRADERGLILEATPG